MTAHVPAAVLAAVAAVLAGGTPAADPVTKAERDGLAALHHYTVKLFINQAGFGVSRVEPPLTDILNPPKSAADGPTGPPYPNPDPVVVKADKDGKAGHHSFARVMTAGYFVPLADPKKVWQVKGVQLVGLVKNPEPVVYLAAAADKAKDKAEVKTRRPDAFETKALEVIRGGGGQVQAERTATELRAVAGIYAGQQCLRCHERPGEMLGAFSYRLTLEDGAPGGRTAQP